MTKKGAQYRVRKKHPRRDQPLGDITDKAGNVIAKAGETCEKVSAAHLESMIRNGYVEKISARRKDK